MNTRLKAAARSHFTLGELILAVSSASRNSHEAALAVADLLQTRRVIVTRARTTRGAR